MADIGDKKAGDIIEDDDTVFPTDGYEIGETLDTRGVTLRFHCAKCNDFHDTAILPVRAAKEIGERLVEIACRLDTKLVN
jgi:hypothetical protein